MATRLVAVDASSLIGLAKAGAFGLLRDLFGTIAVTRIVRDEVLAREDLPGAQELRSAIDARWASVHDVDADAEAFADLDAGESSTLVLAHAHRGRCLVVMDERHGRSQAEKLGTFGLAFVLEPLSPMPEGLATKLFLPFVKTPVIDLGLGYVPFIAFTLVAIANSVNIADGIDGLAVVPAAFAVAVYGVFAYVASHARISDFLIFPFTPGAGEVTIICCTVFGACLGFLWFNSYPANVIMGDTGSMALGGLLGTVVVLVKQEFLFLIVGGVFVGEALSVVIQEKIGIRWLGRRFFRSAPVHHHFQACGLADTKIVIRFWIIAGILALMGLATLKIR